MSATSASPAKQRFACLPLVVLTAALVSCAGVGLRSPFIAVEPADKPPPSAADLYADAVRTLIAQGQFYAAVAHIQEDRRQHGDTVELRLLEAHARRNLNQVSTATALYQNVLRSQPGDAFAAEAHQGLGRMAAGKDSAAALRELREAVRLAPASADIRNDYGYVLMQARRYPEARLELATASELAPGDPRPRNNLFILLLASGDEAAALKLAQASGMDEPLLARLKSQAQSLKSPVVKAAQGAATTAPAPAAPSRPATGKSS